MVISSFISSILVLALGVWAYMRLESSMNMITEKQLLIEPSKLSYKMWKDMPVTMYQSFTFFNLTNWNQVKSIGQKPRFVEVGPYVYRTIWTKSDINFSDEERLVSFAERKQWIFQAHLSKGSEDDQIWTINTPLMTALALIQNAPVITRNIVSVILDGLGEGAFIKRPIRGLLFEGYSDLIVSVGPLFDRRFSNFNGKFAYLYNKNDSIDGQWTVSTGVDDLASLNRITKFQNSIVNMSSSPPQGLNEVKAECAPAWSLEQATNGQLFASFNQEIELAKQLLASGGGGVSRSQRSADSAAAAAGPGASAAAGSAGAPTSTSTQAPLAKRFFARNAHHHQQQQHHSQQQQQDLVQNPFRSAAAAAAAAPSATIATDKAQISDLGKFIFYPDLCRPIHLLPSKQEHAAANGIKATRYFIDPRVFMNSSQAPGNKCFEMNPRPPLANALAATINSVTGANVAMPNLVGGASSPFAMFSPAASNSNNQHHQNHHHHHADGASGLFERSNLGAGSLGSLGSSSSSSSSPASFLNNALHGFGAAAAAAAAANAADQQTSSSNQAPISRLGRVRQLFSNIVSQRMSAASPGSLLPSLLPAGPAGLLIGAGHHFGAGSSTARNSPDEPQSAGGALSAAVGSLLHPRHHAHNHHAHHDNPAAAAAAAARQALPSMGEALAQGGSQPVPSASAMAQAAPQPPPPPPAGHSDRWITQFRFKWPRGVFSIGQCQLGAPIYASLPHFLDADEYYLEQVDGLRPNRSLHEFYIDMESTLRSVPVGAKARLQLNVATPELRFRNIPNAMIPVLWQEVTFEIDKPVLTMLFWSFTMLSSLCTLTSLVLIGLGFILMASSFVGGFRQRRLLGKAPPSDTNSVHSSRSSRSSSSSSSSIRAANHLVEGQRSSWQPHLMRPPASRLAGRAAGRRRSSNQQRQQHSDGNHSADETIRHGAAINHAFSSCREFQSAGRLNASATGRLVGPPGHSDTGSSGSSTILQAGGGAGSPGNQPSSRASSHCELVSSLGTINCAGCLLACLRHSQSTAAAAAAAATTLHSLTVAPADHHNHHQHHHHQHHHHQQNNHNSAGSSDTSIVIQQHQQQQQQPIAASRSDIDSKASILTASESLADSGSPHTPAGSCNSSIYAQRTFNK